jgi:hypothetical protein
MREECLLGYELTMHLLCPMWGTFVKWCLSGFLRRSMRGKGPGQGIDGAV